VRVGTISQSICSRSARASSSTAWKSGSCSVRASSFEAKTSSIESTRTVCPNDVSFVRLEQPFLGRPLGAHPDGGECSERALRVLLADEEVDVVVGPRPAAGPGREPATEHEQHLCFAQRGGRALHARDESLDILATGRHQGRFYPGGVFPQPRVRVSKPHEYTDSGCCER